MNRHFRDTRYHLERAYGTAKAGVGAELGSIRSPIDALLGREEEPEPDRFDRGREVFATLRARAAGGIRRAARRTRVGVVHRRRKRSTR